jgi:hypothetical protein
LPTLAITVRRAIMIAVIPIYFNVLEDESEVTSIDLTASCSSTGIICHTTLPEALLGFSQAVSPAQVRQVAPTGS